MVIPGIKNYKNSTAKLWRTHLNGSMDPDTPTLPADTSADKLTDNIKSICEEITAKSVYWWSSEISTLRRNANHARIYQRKEGESRLGFEEMRRRGEISKAQTSQYY
ncbi:Uncharacterized protein FWK35_00022277 [Aphis craccivora]|uniref:Uncharacterized protein n=1 Tax=Aphis craccivora TaxID=307492 RepID=A0A6G0YSL4_APHCR|nr:Uncharacterized protein FWK35_00022277 [Aphis craccivora]